MIHEIGNLCDDESRVFYFADHSNIIACIEIDQHTTQRSANLEIGLYSNVERSLDAMNVWWPNDWLPLSQTRAFAKSMARLEIGTARLRISRKIKKNSECFI